MTAADQAQHLAEMAVREVASGTPDGEVRRHLLDLANVLRVRPTFHVVHFTLTGWTISHPLIGCASDLFNCPLNAAAAGAVVRRLGSFRCEIDADGELIVGEEIST